MNKKCHVCGGEVYIWDDKVCDKDKEIHCWDCCSLNIYGKNYEQKTGSTGTCQTPGA